MPRPLEPIPKLLYDDIILGLILSDAYISNPVMNKRHSCLQLAQTPKRIDFLYSIQEYFLTLGLKSSIRISHSKIKDKEYSTAYLSTSNNIVFDKLREWWYGDTKKKLPSDLKLTPKIISYWFQGDGYSRYINDGKSVEILIATDSFSKNDVEIVCLQLKHDFNINFHVWFRYNKYYSMKCVKNDDTERFMNLVEPYIHPVFQYKIKHLDKFTKFEELKESGKLYTYGDSYRVALTPNIFCKSKIPN